jgi:secondary thiamine-phosphate synthase enzyme
MSNRQLIDGKIIMSWFQKEIFLQAKSRGFHLITQEIESQIPELRRYKIGLAHVFIQHTSAALALNENADPTVRQDMESHFNRLAPEDAPYFIHTYEGPDDMPAHIKAVLLGSSVTVPISNGRLNLGTWQGIYLCEHRNRGGRRRLVITLTGQTS